ncbi:helix-turn-helix transcriptional regulator [Haliangium sp.]|uniref:helix-turn-helix transcriptional regulator n=1 Tax=Haliangium sp. TaxID=2663208 RepID=UPI003D1194CD
MSKNDRQRKTSASRRGAIGRGDRGRGDRAKRLLDLVMLLLRARTPVSFREIREQFSSYMTSNAEAGLRAFERDKSDLVDLGVPVRYVTPEEDDTLEEGGYVIEWRRFRLPEVKLTADEVSALVVAASVARAVPGGSYPKIVDLALKKLAFDVQEVPDTPSDFLEQVRETTRREPVLVHFPENRAANARELSDRFAELEAATRNRKRVTLRYRSASSGELHEREVDPYGLLYRQGTWYLVGYCHLRDDVRSFRCDRIDSLEIGPRPKSPDFDRPSDFDLRAYACRSPWTFTPELVEEVEIEIRPEAADTINEDFGPGATRTTTADGATRIRFDCGNPDYVVSRVLAAKGGLVIRDGARVLARFADELEALQERYAS